jgi:hypothetical protein
MVLIGLIIIAAAAMAEPRRQVGPGLGRRAAVDDRAAAPGEHPDVRAVDQLRHPVRVRRHSGGRRSDPLPQARRVDHSSGELALARVQRPGRPGVGRCTPSLLASHARCVLRPALPIRRGLRRRRDRYLVTSMTEGQLRMVITEPAKKAASSVQDDLVDALLTSGRRSPGCLRPLGSPNGCASARTTALSSSSVTGQ